MTAPLQAPARAPRAVTVRAAPRAEEAAGLARASDEELVALALALPREGSRAHAAFAELVRRHHARLFAFLTLRTASHADAEDAAQEAFILAWRRLESFRRGTKFSTWLFAIGANRAVTAHRRASAARRAELGAAPIDRPDSNDQNEQVDQVELGRRLWTLARCELPADQFGCLWLRYAEAMEPAEIAIVLGRTGVGIRVALHRARRHLAALARRDSLGVHPKEPTP